jgi:hypothetical protein
MYICLPSKYTLSTSVHYILVIHKPRWSPLYVGGHLPFTSLLFTSSFSPHSHSKPRRPNSFIRITLTYKHIHIFSPQNCFNLKYETKHLFSFIFYFFHCLWISLHLILIISYNFFQISPISVTKCIPAQFSTIRHLGFVPSYPISGFLITTFDWRIFTGDITL